jgi:hypothetical protein
MVNADLGTPRTMSKKFFIDEGFNAIVIINTVGITIGLLIYN